jgi:hypothetical protein
MEDHNVQIFCIIGEKNGSVKTIKVKNNMDFKMNSGEVIYGI